MAAMTGRDCILITDDHLPHIGGSRLYVHRVAEILRDRVTVVTRHRQGCEAFDAEAPYRTRRVRLGGRLLPRPQALGETLDAAALARAARREKGARCFLAGEMIPAALAACWAAHLWRVPYGVILHDEPLAGCGRFEARLRKRLLSGARAIVVSSSYPESRARAITEDAVPIFRAAPGVDLEAFQPGEPEPGLLAGLGVEPGRFVLSAGRLVDYKNVEAVIRALAAPEEKGLKAVIVGEGPQRAALEALAHRLRLADRVVFAGRVGKDALVSLYRGAFAYVFPSMRSRGQRHEGIGMAALEAAACGCPVIVSSHTSATDFVEDGVTGLVFDPEKDAALERALGRFLSDKTARRAIALACTENVRRHYAWATTAHAFEAAIDHMCAARRHDS